MQRTLDALLVRAVDDGVPGVAAVVVDDRGPRYEGAAGDRRIGSGTAMTPSDVFRIASMTKPLTSAAALQLVDRGRLALDEPAFEACPELGEVSVLTGFSSDGSPELRRPSRPITLRDLLSHTAGFAYEMWNADIARFMAEHDLPSIMSASRAALDVPLVAEPGSRWEYGISTDWVGLMIESAVGVPLGDYLASSILSPLGMVDTAFTPQDGMEDRVTSMYLRAEDGSIGVQETPRPDPEYHSGGGGLLSTPVDYGRFITMVLNGGRWGDQVVLNDNIVQLMTSPATGEMAVGRLGSVRRQLSNDVELFPQEPKAWSLAGQVHRAAGSTGRAAGTLMWAGLTNCYFWIDRERGIGGALMSQVLPFGDEQILGLYYDFEREAYSHL